MGNHQRLLFLLLICSFNQLLFRTLPFMTLAQKISEEEPLQEGSGGLNPDDEDYADHESSGNLPADGTHEDVGHVPVITHSPTTTTKSIKITTTTTSSKSKYLTPPPRFDEDVEVDEKGVYGRKTTTTKIPPIRDDTEFNMIYIIIGIVGFLVLLLALIIVFMCCCRKPKENNDYTQGIVRTKDYV